MSHFTCFVIVPSNKPAIEVSEDEAENLITGLLSPYDENSEVDPYQVKCHCVGMIAKKKSRAHADRMVGTVETIRQKFWEMPEDLRSEYAWKDAIAPYIAAEEQAYNIDPDRDNPNPECDDCHGSGLRSTTYNPNSKWDWYSVGGRWNGIFTPSYNVADDPRNYETCFLCDGTGKRDDAVGRNARAENPDYNCNGCNGKGKRLKFPTEWIHPEGANIANPKAILAMIESDKDVYPFAMVTPDEGWVESASMGWWAITTNEKEKEVWNSSVVNLLKKYLDGHIVINVDCHI